MMEKLKNNFVLITGSARGLGRELALVFADNDFNIILHDRTMEDLKEVKKQILSKGVDCCALAGDLRIDKTFDELFKIANENGVSVLINNAGVPCPKLPIQDLSNMQIDDLLLTNLVAPIKLTSKIFSVFLKNGRGTIINMNSMSGLENQELRTVYCASRWGLRGFSDTLKLEANKNNIRIIDIYPSRMKTRPEFTVGMEPKDVAQKIYETYKNTSLDRLILDERPNK